MSGMHSGQRPVTQEDYQAVKRLHRKGLSRNAIAKEIHRSGRTISKIADDLGLNFDRVKTAKATEAKVLDAKARRAALALKLLETAERLHDQVFAEATVYNFGGKENTYNSATLPIPPHADQLRIMQAIGVAVDKSIAIDKHDAATGLPEVESLLERIASGLAAKHGTGDDEYPDAPDA